MAQGVLPAAELRPEPGRWLKNKEIAALLISTANHPRWTSAKTQQQPSSGALFLYDRDEVKFRKDGHVWEKRKDGKSIREDHAKLKIGGKNVRSSVLARQTRLAL